LGRGEFSKWMETKANMGVRAIGRREKENNAGDEL